MLVPDPETPDGERIKVFDFGIAKLVADSLRPQSPQGVDFRTQTGMIMGTPTHMAPEQVRGLTDIDGRADVYSLGIIFYQLLVGHTPFVAASAGELLSMHLRDTPTPLRKLDPSIPEPIAELVHRMLQKESSARPEMVEVVLELEAQGPSKRSSSSAALVVPREKSGPSRVRPHGQTLQQAAGQTFSTVVANRRFALAITASGALVALAALLLFSDSSSCVNLRDGIRGPATQVSSTVRWAIDSDPPHADVISADTGATLGQTPWSREEPRGSGQIKVRVRLSGYSDQSVILDRNANTNQTVYLLANRGAAAADPGPEATPSTKASAKATPATIHWTISTRPKGAEVVRADDNTVLGKTPWEQRQEAASGILKVLLRKPGYVETSLLLDRGSDMQQMIQLQSTTPRPKKALKEEDIPLFDADESGSGPAQRR